MSDLVKWGIIIAIVVACLVTFGIYVGTSDYAVGLSTALSEANAWLGQYTPYLVKGRKLLNNFLPPVLLNVTLWFACLYKVAEWAIGVVRMIVDAIYKDA